MKKTISIFGILFFTFFTFSQEEIQNEELKKIPAITLKTMDGIEVNTSNLGFKGPVIIDFWTSWCPICKRELSTLNDLYSDWQAETGVTIVIVSIDDEKTKNSVSTLVNGKGWDFFVLMDPNGDFKRAMGVNHTPHYFLIDEKGSIVYSHNNYAPGDEDILYEELLKLTKKENGGY